MVLGVACGNATTHENTSDAGVHTTDSAVVDASPSDAGLPNPPCIQGGPDYEPPAPVASLSVTPAYLGSKTLDVSSLPRSVNLPTAISAPLAVSGSHLGLLVFSGFAVFDLQGNLTKAVPAANANWLDSHTVIGDKHGFYYSADGIYAVDELGNPRWKRALRTNIDEASSEVHDGIATTLLLDPENDALYGAASDGYLYGLRGTDGSLLWERQYIANVQLFGLRIYGGIGDRFSLRIANGDPTQVAVETGTVLGALKVDNRPALPIEFSTHGVARTITYTPPSQWITDGCGTVIQDSSKKDQSASYSLYWSFENHLIKSVDPKNGPPRHLRVEDTNGQILHDVTTEVRIVALGADGTIYGFEAKATGYRLVAFDLELHEKWSIDTPSKSSDLGPVLLDDGRLLWLDETENRTSGAVVLHSVQTKSPGLAHTGNPLYVHDNQRTGWAHSWK